MCGDHFILVSGCTWNDSALDLEHEDMDAED